MIKRKTNIFVTYFWEIALGRGSGFQFPCKKYIFVPFIPSGAPINDCFL